MNPSAIEIAATVCFVLAIAHTFLVGRFQKLAFRFAHGSLPARAFHTLGEVEVSFGLWALVFLAYYAVSDSILASFSFLKSRQFTEPVFVLVIMSVCATKPVLSFTRNVIETVSRILPFHQSISSFVVGMTLGPLLGSLITEPAAMTVTVLILIDTVFKRTQSKALKYGVLGLVFVNVSIGGVLTPYAAPPVLMVARKWNWDLGFMLTSFGWKAVVACLLSSASAAFFFRRELRALDPAPTRRSEYPPAWVTSLHLLFLVAIVSSHARVGVFAIAFLFFLGFYFITRKHQSDLKLRESALVAFFLAGIVVLGEPQRWWLEPLLSGTSDLGLYLGSIALTSVTDNAALAYLGSQISSLSESARYALIAGSVIGGGLTVIANAPNPVGHSFLNPYFGEQGISPIWLAISAAPFTVVAALVFWLL